MISLYNRIIKKKKKLLVTNNSDNAIFNGFALIFRIMQFKYNIIIHYYLVVSSSKPKFKRSKSLKIIIKNHYDNNNRRPILEFRNVLL